MKGKFKKKTAKPAISTASLPDIIFILLFFFMVTTVLRDEEMLVQTRIPSATEIEKLDMKTLVATINIGPPIDVQRWGTAPRIQLNDQFARVDDIPAFVAAERRARDERVRDAMTFSLKVDRETRMGIVTDVKQELRMVNALKINYSTISRHDQ